MAKKNYQALYKLEKQKVFALQEAINKNLTPRLVRAEETLLGIVLGIVDVEKLVENYAKHNPDVKIETDESGKKYVVREDFEKRITRKADKKTVGKVLEG